MKIKQGDTPKNQETEEFSSISSRKDTKVAAGDFIEIDYIARIKSSNRVFDLTLADSAKKEGIFRENYTYQPLILCVGENHVIKGLDEAIAGKEVGKEFELDVLPEKAFGQRNAKLIQLTSKAVFKKQNMDPFPGLQLSIDGAIATVRSVSGGRVILDFNNPLSGQVIHYWVRINRQVIKPEEKLKALAYNLLAEKDAKVELKDTPKSKIRGTTELRSVGTSESKAFQGKTATLTLKTKDSAIKKKFEENAKKLVPEVKITLK